MCAGEDEGESKLSSLALVRVGARRRIVGSTDVLAVKEMTWDKDRKRRKNEQKQNETNKTALNNMKQNERTGRRKNSHVLYFLYMS